MEEVEQVPVEDGMEVRKGGVGQANVAFLVKNRLQLSPENQRRDVWHGDGFVSNRRMGFQRMRNINRIIITVGGRGSGGWTRAEVRHHGHERRHGEFVAEGTGRVQIVIVSCPS